MAVTLQDRVYFGTCWQMLDRDVATADIRLGDGFHEARVLRSADGDFFAGIVEKRDASGRVTDVILSFAGAHGLDAVQGESILLGLPLDEATRVTLLYDQLLNDPTYSGARIHVTGHSLGAGYTEYVLAHSLATYGAATTDARADFVAFGAPNWGVSAARHFGLDDRALDGHFVDYTAANDPVLINGVERVGTTYYLPAYDEIVGPEGLALNPVASHAPYAYVGALGLPEWLSAGDQQAVIAEMQPHITTPYDADYGPAGTLGMRIDGDDAANILTGLDGDDVIIGDGGRDSLSGGGGADRFRFDRADDSMPLTSDAILDFSQADGDRIDLSGIDARPSLLFDDAFTLVGGNSFTAAGQLRVWHDRGDTFVAGNVDADAAAEFVIKLEGNIDLTAADFIL